MSFLQENPAMHQLQSQQAKVLDKIDELRNLGVGGLVALPQLIVCGSQSSGKSSVLEAISRVRFPTKSGVCTRFATEVILRRNPETKFKVSIEPGNSRENDKERQRLQSFSCEAFLKDQDLPKLIEQAKECMGIGHDDSQSERFSDDVLKVEISGPDQPELSLVDLPGLYTGSSRDQDDEGIQVVRDITERYMKNERSIVLAVISARYDFNNQEILNIAKKFDPKMEKVLAIVTQPDRLEARSEEEDRYLRFVKNEDIKLKLGWHVLRNRGDNAKKSSDDERDSKEREFFDQGRWASLPRRQVGIESLRHRLSTVLLNQIRHSIPSLIVEIHEKIEHHRQELKQLGTERSTIQGQRGFLLDISSGFAQIVRQALDGLYTDRFFDEQDHSTSDAAAETIDYRRLRAVIRELNEFFADAMSINGQRRRVDILPIPEPQSDINNPTYQSYLDCWSPEPTTEQEIIHEIIGLVKTNRGIEVPGSSNPLLVGKVFRNQASPWERIAECHLTTSWKAAKNFIFLVFQHLTDEDTFLSLREAVIIPKLDEINETLRKKLEELTSYTKTGHPLPIGRTYLNQVLYFRREYQMSWLKDHFNQTQTFKGSEQKESENMHKKTMTMEEVQNAVHDMKFSSEVYSAMDILLQMHAYYEIAILGYIDNISILAIENCLLRPLLTIFTNQTVNSMTDQQIKEIASESPHKQKERERLNQGLEKLEKGMRTLRAFNADHLALPRVSRSESRSSSISGSPKPHGRNTTPLSSDFHKLQLNDKVNDEHDQDDEIL
ncbi:hypothetical protein N7462_011406 [Penicillium macrosclerotiorum]|uniref:uncharacterized protein n=1 Tax=Penicillium macrosclerotiorum TaxID=303699 RepID=UPI002547D33B|nr:uncharacterized protein N7462_011406 [Penicillium macrosclerotiorum]KAJ5664593.1 hypothetical protein N7462_011406 [Penicillium macrosclerotiorum]